jgi:DeoR family transcriptional regulator, glycerol-3-phosphate regulon repressor
MRLRSRAPLPDRGIRNVASSEQRRRAIVEVVRRQGFAPIDALASQFAVTPQTIRRDINELSTAGALQRFHGGAGLPSSVENLAYPTRQVLCLEEKGRIARLAARHVPDNASLFINIGTTTEEVAKALLHHHGLSVVTNNLNVAGILAGKPDFRLIVTGGVVRSHDRGLVGEATIDLIRQFKVDIGIIGISGIDLDGALLDFDYREVRVAQAILENSRRTFLMADHTKFGRNAMVRLGSIVEIDALFTDRQPPSALVEIMAEAEVQLFVD